MDKLLNLSYVLLYISIMLFIISCSNVERTRCDNSSYKKIDSINLQVFNDYILFSNTERAKSTFEPSIDNVKRALSVAFRQTTLHDDPLIAQVAGNVNIQGDSILVFSLMYEYPPDRFNECDMLYGSDGFFADRVGHFVYRIRDEYVRTGWMIPK